MPDGITETILRAELKRLVKNTETLKVMITFL